MAKISVNIPDEELEKMDRFVEENPEYGNRSEFIREAVKDEMDETYDVLFELAGSWSDEKAEEARARLRELEKEDIKAQKADL